MQSQRKPERTAGWRFRVWFGGPCHARAGAGAGEASGGVLRRAAVRDCAASIVRPPPARGPWPRSHTRALSG